MEELYTVSPSMECYTNKIWNNYNIVTCLINECDLYDNISFIIVWVQI